MLLITTFISGLFFGFAFSNLKLTLNRRKRRKAADKVLSEQLGKTDFSAIKKNGFEANKLDISSYWWKDNDYNNEKWWEEND